MIKKFLDQDSFNWYQLLPNYKSIAYLESIFNKVKLDNPDFLADQEDKIRYDEFVGSKWTYRDYNGKVYAVIFVTSQGIELMIVKNDESGKKLIELLQND